MKEKIYTIPINEALDENTFCPFCYIYKKLEDEAVQYTVGSAMMEPDFRIITNQNGFCQKHVRDLHAESKALSLSLIFDTHLQEIEKLFNLDLKSSKKSLFKKTAEKKTEFISQLERISSSCAVCMRIDHSLKRYFETFIYMLKTEKGFLEKVLSTDGFCMEHFSTLSHIAGAKLSDSDFEKLFLPVVNLQKSRIIKHKAHIKAFSDQFNCSNSGKESEFPKDILLKTAKLLNGEFTPKEKKLDNI